MGDRVTDYIIQRYTDELKEEGRSKELYYINAICAALLCGVAYFAELKWVVVAASIIIMCWLSEISQRLRIALIHLGVVGVGALFIKKGHSEDTESKG